MQIWFSIDRKKKEQQQERRGWRSTSSGLFLFFFWQESTHFWNFWVLGSTFGIFEASLLSWPRFSPWWPRNPNSQKTRFSAFFKLKWNLFQWWPSFPLSWPRNPNSWIFHDFSVFFCPKTATFPLNRRLFVFFFQLPYWWKKWENRSFEGKFWKIYGFQKEKIGDGLGFWKWWPNLFLKKN